MINKNINYVYISDKILEDWHSRALPDCWTARIVIGNKPGSVLRSCFRSVDQAAMLEQEMKVWFGIPDQDFLFFPAFFPDDKPSSVYLKTIGCLVAWKMMEKSRAFEDMSIVQIYKRD